jgi:hypothetical protein
VTPPSHAAGRSSQWSRCLTAAAPHWEQYPSDAISPPHCAHSVAMSPFGWAGNSTPSGALSVSLKAGTAPAPGAGSGLASGGARPSVPEPARLAPQLSQNVSPGSDGSPQAGQIATSATPASTGGPGD